MDELKTLLDAASEEGRGMILTALYTGQRLKDIASLTWANVDLQREDFRFAKFFPNSTRHVRWEAHCHYCLQGTR